jgi:hypothetical protein
VAKRQEEEGVQSGARARARGLATGSCAQAAEAGNSRVAREQGRLKGGDLGGEPRVGWLLGRPREQEYDPVQEE